MRGSTLRAEAKVWFILSTSWRPLVSTSERRFLKTSAIVSRTRGKEGRPPLSSGGK